MPPLGLHMTEKSSGTNRRISESVNPPHLEGGVVVVDRLHQLLRSPLVVDLRNLYEPEKMAAAGFRYVSIGRPEGVPEIAQDPAHRATSGL